ncbi:hypothetical protein R6Q59_008351 [Mikania micrantha]
MLVKQLHKIFLLCDLPSCDYWKNQSFLMPHCLNHNMLMKVVFGSFLKTCQHVIYNLLKPYCLRNHISEGSCLLLLHLTYPRSLHKNICKKHHIKCKLTNRFAWNEGEGINIHDNIDNRK